MSATESAARSTDNEDELQFRHTGSVLVVDDEAGIRNYLKRALEPYCPLVETADSAAHAEALRQRCHFDLIILDVRLPGKSGIEWLEELRDQGVRTDVILMTAYADLDTAIVALRAGAADFILKPFRRQQMLSAVQRCLERRWITRENYLLKRQITTLVSGEGMIGQTPAMRQLFDVIQRVSPTPSTLLIEGESGTGKELVARSIHKASGRKGSFVPLNCGSISPELLESELFGHIKGAFTGAHGAREGLFSFANQGTLFLDEIGEMPLAMQTKLLRVLEERAIRPVGSDRETPVEVRVIAATNRRLEQEVENGSFRKDLYYRLNVLTLEVPPLRERLDDIPELVRHFIQLLAPGLGVAPTPFTQEDIALLQGYHWPGNVRELRNVVERSLLLGTPPGDCLSRNSAATGSEPEMGSGRDGYDLELPLEEVEKQHMLAVLQHCDGNKSEAARRLGVSRKTMERKLQRWGR